MDIVLGIKDILRRIWELVTGNELILIGIAGGIVTALFRTLKTNLEVLWSLIQSKVMYSVSIHGDSQLYDALNAWYYNNYPDSFRNVAAEFKASHKHGETSYQLIYTPLSSLDIVKFGNKKIFLKKISDEMYDNGVFILEHEYILSCFCKGDRIKKFLSYLEEYWNEYKSGIKGISIILKSDYDSRTLHYSVYKIFDDLFFKGKEDLIRHLEEYNLNKEFFLSKKLRYKTSILLEGIPGSGKTAVSFAIAHHLKRSIYYVAPNAFSSDNDFQEYMREIEPGSVILMEDVDTYFGNRKKGEGSKTALSFTSILNTLDGLFSPEDVVIVMTTNHPEELDEALLRKGRVDFRLNMGVSESLYIKQYLEHYFDTDLNGYTKTFPALTMVDVEHICKDSKDLKEALYKLDKIK